MNGFWRQCVVITAASWKATDIGLCFLLQGQSLSIGDLQLGWIENMQIIMLRTLGMPVLVKKRQMSLYGESQFDSQFSQLLQLINAWLKKLSDDCEHSYLKKHNGKVLWSHEPNIFNVLNVQYCECCSIKVLLRLPICGRDIDWLEDCSEFLSSIHW